MKRRLTGGIVLFLIFLFTAVVPSFAATTLDFFGKVIYDEINGTQFPERFVPRLATQTFGYNEELREGLNSDAPYYGVGMLAYDFSWDLPDWDGVYDWSLSVDAWAAGFYKINGVRTDFEETFSDSFGLGTGSLRQFFGGASLNDVLDMLGEVPMEGWDDSLGGYLILGNLDKGKVYFALANDIDDILGCDTGLQKANVRFGGRFSLSYATTPEPGSMVLLGIGLAALARRRKKA
ncbi:MAG: PEP-CTERM sorting domain-containing protein [Candidatus Omnitrophota bacterium]